MSAWGSRRATARWAISAPEQRLKYTALGRPVNLAARLEGLAKPGEILIDDTTHGLIHDHVSSEQRDQVKVKGFARPVQVYRVGEFLSEAHREKRQQLSRVGKHVEVNVIDSSDMHALIAELRDIQEDFEKKLTS